MKRIIIILLILTLFSGCTTTIPKAEITKVSNNIFITWDNVAITLNLNNNNLLGIGDVKINNINIRSPTTTSLPKFEKILDESFVSIPNTRCELISYETLEDDTAVIHTLLYTSEGNINLDWIFTPWKFELEGLDYTGFGYKFSISSPINISKLDFKCSWELNSNVNGKTLLTRREKTNWERVCSDDFFLKNNLPSGMQQPDYQYDSSGSLSSFIFPPSQIENSLEKDGSLLWLDDKFNFGETKQIETPYRVVLYAEQGGIDEYTFLLDKLNEDYRSLYGLKESDYTPTVLASSYLQVGAMGTAPNFRNLADNWLSVFKEYNFKQFLIIYLWNSDGRMGYDGNRLATLDIDFHPDDEDDIKYLSDKAHELNLKFMVWLSTCYSQLSPLFDLYDWQLQDVKGNYYVAQSGNVYLVGYGTDYPSYAIQKLTSIKDEYGFDGIWHDSFGATFSIDYFDYPIEPSTNEQLQYLADLQNLGYSYFLESLGPFYSSSGSVAFTPSSETEEKRDINLAFGGKEYLAYKITPVLFSAEDFSPLQIDYYKFLANKAVPMLAFEKLNESEGISVSQINKDYNAVSLYMDKRYVLSNGIFWRDKETNTQVLFAFDSFSYTTNGNIVDVTTGEQISNEGFITESRHTYKITSSNPVPGFELILILVSIGVIIWIRRKL